MRGLRRRYGHAVNRPFTIEQSGNLFLVKLTGAYSMGSGKEIPAGKTLGTINERGTISVWRSAGYNPRGYGEIAKILLNDAKHDLKSEGRIMAKQRAKEAAHEQKSGSFIVRIDGGDEGRFHDFARARAYAEEELLDRNVGTQAKFYRAGPGTWSDGRPMTGAPWTEPFHIEETYEWNGQKRVGMPRGK